MSYDSSNYVLEQLYRRTLLLVYQNSLEQQRWQQKQQKTNLWSTIEAEKNFFLFNARSIFCFFLYSKFKIFSAFAVSKNKCFFLTKTWRMNIQMDFLTGQVASQIKHDARSKKDCQINHCSDFPLVQASRIETREFFSKHVAQFIIRWLQAKGASIWS